MITSNKEMKDIMKTVKFLEDAGLLINDVSKTIENVTKKVRFFDILLVTLGASILDKC